ncbi:MAG: hypothetical protein JW806_01800 [Sedimentisphaerales bacterium]|nr:hypothetical protein [Sedimentisphaerales bacterium]
MSISYSSLCDDFFVDMYINTRFDLPNERDILLTFFERISRQFPLMQSLIRDGGSSYSLEEDPNSGQNRWVSIDSDRLGAGFVNPDSFAQAFELPRLVIDLIPYMLSVRSLDIDSLDLTFGMDFDCSGNHNEIIAEALFGGSAFAKIFDGSPGPLNLSPSVVVATDDDCTTRMKLTVDSKTDESEIRRKKFDKDKPISLYLTARQYPAVGKDFNPKEVFERLSRAAVEFMDEKVVPNFVMPLTNAIAHRR